MEKEKHASKKFDCKAPIFISTGTSVTFNGAKSTGAKYSNQNTKMTHLAKLSASKNNIMDKKKYIVERMYSWHLH